MKSKYRIRRVDEFNFCIEERKMSKTGVERWDLIGYYRHLEDLLRSQEARLLTGIDTKTILASVEQAKKDLLLALHEAVKDDALKWTVREVSDDVLAKMQAGRTRKAQEVLL